MSEFTRILEAVQQGDPQAAHDLLPLVYEELRRLAAQKMAQERPSQTLQPTALVHEAWLRLAGVENLQWNGRAHFFGAAAEAMRRILIENARRKRAERHGGRRARLDIAEIDIPVPTKDEELLAVSTGETRCTRQTEGRIGEVALLRGFDDTGGRRSSWHFRPDCGPLVELQSRLVVRGN